MTGSPIPVAITGDIDDGKEDLEGCLGPLLETLASYEVPMTFPVTSVALKGKSAKFRTLLDRGHEIAGHGETHQAFTGSVETQVLRLRRMNQEFRDELGFTPLGFRSPYLLHDANLYQALSIVGLRYDSSRIAIDPLIHLRHGWRPGDLAYRGSTAYVFRYLKRYISGQARPKPFEVAPQVLEIPVLDLDDWHFFESPRGPGLRSGDEARVADLWLRAMAHFDHDRNALVLQVHPKRISPEHLGVLEDFLEGAKASRHPFLTLQEFVRPGVTHGR